VHGHEPQRSYPALVPEPTLTELADKLDDLARLLTRQTGVLGALTERGADTARPDLPLLVELHALHTGAVQCAASARTRRERAAFTAMGAGLERLLAGRGGRVVAPAAGDAFSAVSMEAAEVIDADDPDQDRRVARLLEPGLDVAGRSVRPARVAVYRHRPR
jgi:molecular chaperone GrpE